ncbi:iron-sulfur-binding ferredoxin reductase [Pseudomonas syringae]|uniref:Iron-sulfur-binding ferredoxin reductase n=2 Tax=Pseudomonas syringae TaxID=317 RepID=A0A9Q4A3M1_PSESX|nr:iron-sulfur-binding ferredoxin reductase [Pseudomonas syringae]MCF5629614.1 iron-sulfur-binding ferredoxin reductase [Pseudomonas syringae]
MPQLRVGERSWTVAAADNLLDALNDAGVAVPFCCLAGSCHACLVRCVQGEPADALPGVLPAEKRRQGWRLACQCRVTEDLAVEVFDPQRDGLPARVTGCDWLSPTLLRLRLEPLRPLRYSAGQHQVLWTDSGVARPYSLASLPGEEPFLEFHIDCRYPGAFCDVARHLRVGDELRLGELRGGALRYDSDWQENPLLLLASGSGLGPLWGVLREALRQEHQGSIRLIHLARDSQEHYLAAELQALTALYPHLSVQLITAQTLQTTLADLRLLSRRAMALVCGSADSVEMFAKRLYLAGLPRNQLLADVFVARE